MKKSNGSTTIGLEILDPNRFPSRRAIRRFVAGDEHVAFKYAVQNALGEEGGEYDFRFLGSILEDAREGAWALTEDLASLAKAAVSGPKDVRAIEGSPSFDASKAPRYRGALLAVALLTGPSDSVRSALVAHLGRRPEAS